MVTSTMQTTANRIATVSVNAANTGDKGTFITLDTPINHGKYKRIIFGPFYSPSPDSFTRAIFVSDRTYIYSVAEMQKTPSRRKTTAQMLRYQCIWTSSQKRVNSSVHLWSASLCELCIVSCGLTSIIKPFIASQSYPKLNMSARNLCYRSVVVVVVVTDIRKS